MKLKHLLAAAALAAALALPAQAAIGEANITPDTPMAELRANPSVVGAGLYTYNQEQDSPGHPQVGRYHPAGVRQRHHRTGLRRRAQPHDRKLQCGHPDHP